MQLERKILFHSKGTSSCSGGKQIHLDPSALFFCFFFFDKDKGTYPGELADIGKILRPLKAA